MVCKLNCNLLEKYLQLNSSLVCQKPIAQAILLENFVVTDQSTKTVKLFHLKRFAIYGIPMHKFRHSLTHTHTCTCTHAYMHKYTYTLRMCSIMHTQMYACTHTPLVT